MASTDNVVTRPIGSEFGYTVFNPDGTRDQVTLKVVEDNSQYCRDSGCFFHHRCQGTLPKRGFCAGIYRTDGKSVAFKQIDVKHY